MDKSCSLLFKWPSSWHVFCLSIVIWNVIDYSFFVVYSIHVQLSLILFSTGKRLQLENPHIAVASNSLRHLTATMATVQRKWPVDLLTMTFTAHTTKRTLTILHAPVLSSSFFSLSTRVDTEMAPEIMWRKDHFIYLPFWSLALRFSSSSNPSPFGISINHVVGVFYQYEVLSFWCWGWRETIVYIVITKWYVITLADSVIPKSWP